MLLKIEGPGIGEDWVSRFQGKVLRWFWLHGESGWEVVCWRWWCGGGETEEARTGEEESGEEKAGRWAWTWPGRPKVNVGGVWGMMANIVLVEFRYVRGRWYPRDDGGTGFEMFAGVGYVMFGVMVDGRLGVGEC